jgi:hydrogenase nickel incorporation protein HypA/HybF
MLKMVDRIVKDEKLTEVHSITIEIGDLSGVVPRFMSDCWEAVVDRTPYQDTKLIVKTAPGTLRCEDCKEEFRADLDHLVCPQCGSRKLTPLTGRDMTIMEIEAC